MEGRSGLLEAAAAVIVAAMGMLILAGALLTFSRTVRGGGETAARGAGVETGGAGSAFHVRVTSAPDGESVSRDGVLENVHIVETVRSDGVLYSYVADSAAGRNGHDGT